MAQPHDDPFGDRAALRPGIHFEEPSRSAGSSRDVSPYQSTVSLPRPDFGRNQSYQDEEYVEKVPLTSGENFTGGFYPPG